RHPLGRAAARPAGKDGERDVTGRARTTSQSPTPGAVSRCARTSGRAGSRRTVAASADSLTPTRRKRPKDTGPRPPHTPREPLAHRATEPTADPSQRPASASPMDAGQLPQDMPPASAYLSAFDNRVSGASVS